MDSAPIVVYIDRGIRKKNLKIKLVKALIRSVITYIRKRKLTKYD